MGCIKLRQVLWTLQSILMYIPNLIRDIIHHSEDDEAHRSMLSEFGQAWRHTPQLFRTLAFKTRTLEEQLHQSMLNGNLKRAFSFFDLLMIGIGITVGSGVFLLTGTAQALYTGSGTFLAYMILSIPLLCAAACYAELCVELPVAGSAFTYVLTTLGEFPAFITLGFLLMEYALAGAAVARGFSTFFALLCNQPKDVFIVEINADIGLDFFAFAIILLVTAVLCLGVQESSILLSAANIAGILFLVFIAITGFTQASGAVFTTSFFPEDWDGLFQAFATLMFSYVGFDAVANAVEEARRVRDVPKAILGTVGFNAVLYSIMALSLGLMITPAQLLQCVDSVGNPVDVTLCETPNSPAYSVAFVYAFNIHGMPWMQYIIALGAIFTISTTLLVDMFTLARLAMVGAREWLLPPQLSYISPRFQTPLAAQLITGIIVAVIGLLFKYKGLSDIVSFGTLLIIVMVCNTYMARRYYPDVKLRYTSFGAVEAKPRKDHVGPFGIKLSKQCHRLMVWVHIILINALSIACGIYYRVTGATITASTVTTGDLTVKHLSTLYFVLAWFLVTLSMWYWCRIEYFPESWSIPSYLLPWMPSFALLFLLFVEAQLSVDVYYYSIGFLGAFVLIYVMFSMPLSYVQRFQYSKEEEEVRVIELVFSDGKWQNLGALTSQYSITSANTHSSGSIQYGKAESNFVTRFDSAASQLNGLQSNGDSNSSL